MYHLMMSCWQDELNNRLEFKDIVEVLSDEDKQFPLSDMWTQTLPTFDSSTIVLQKEVICKGRYGYVLRAVYSPHDACEMVVAVETINYNTNPNSPASKQVINESQLMCDLRNAAPAQLIQKAQLMYKLRHVNIIDFIGIGFGETPMLVIEFANFGSLRDFLRSHRTTPIERVLAFMQQVVEGMAHMRTCRIVHKCLKATTILLTSQFQAKISNFDFSERN